MKKRILVVEDDKNIAASLEIRLRAAGYRVRRAHNGLERLSAAVTMKPDLILMDVWMPGTVGFLAAERLKHFGLGGIPVIFITASKKEQLSHWAREVGAADFFEKPYDADKLLKAIAKAIAQSTGPATDGGLPGSGKVQGEKETRAHGKNTHC